MDRITAKSVFDNEIGGRWPDFTLSQVLMDDWINFFCKYSPEKIKRAASQYALNYDSFKRPSLCKFREIINAQNVSTYKDKTEKFPQYFLQQNATDCMYFKYGTFCQFITGTSNPDLNLNNIQVMKQNYTDLYGGDWHVIVCNNEEERSQLIRDRAIKNRKGLNDGLQRDKTAIGRQVKDIISSIRFQRPDDKKDVSQV